MGEKIEKTEKGDKTRKLFDYENPELYSDFMHTRIACGFYHCLAISISIPYFLKKASYYSKVKVKVRKQEGLLYTVGVKTNSES